MRKKSSQRGAAEKAGMFMVGSSTLRNSAEPMSRVRSLSFLLATIPKKRGK